MSRQVLEQLMRLLTCRLQQAPQVEEESASYLELHMRLLVRIRPFGASPMCRSGCNKRSLLRPSWWCQVCHGNAASHVTAGAWAPDSASPMLVAHQSQDVVAIEGTELSSWHRRSSASPNRVSVDRGIQGSSSQQRLPQATSHERRNSTLPPRTRRCLADTARCAATRRLARTKNGGV